MLTTPDRRRNRFAGSLPARCLQFVLAVTLIPLVGANPATAQSPTTTQSPVTTAWPDRADVTIHQDHIITRLTWETMAAEGATRIGFRVRASDGGYQSQGTREKSQLKFMHRVGVRYAISLRAFHPGEGWSDWGPEFTVEGGRTTGAPWSITVSAEDRSLTADWVATGAAEYRYKVWSGAGHALAGTTSQTSLTARGLANGATYYVSIQAVYDDWTSPWSQPLPATPNRGDAVAVAIRDYKIDLHDEQAQTLAMMTAIVGATERIDTVTVTASTSDEDLRTADVASFNPAATATTGIGGAWVSDPLRFELVDHEIVTTVRSDHRTVVTSSLQSWILGTLDADHVRVRSRVANFR